MNIIIAGDGKVGATLTKQLSNEGHEVTIIDSNLDVLEHTAQRFDIMTVSGNCTLLPVLVQAGVEKADLLIAATSKDEINLLCALTAHNSNPKLHTIARIRDPQFREQIYKMRDVLGISLMVNPEYSAAKEIERLLKYPAFLKRDTFAKGRIEIVELKIGHDSILKDVTLINLYSIVKCSVLVCTVIRNGKVFIPGGDFVLRENDKIYVTAPSQELTLLLKNLGIITKKIKNIMIAGGGKVSVYLAKLLEKSNISVTIVEQDEKRCEYLAGVLNKADIIHGDASNQQVLLEEGLEDCDALISLTGIDELNMVISLYGNSCGVEKIITKLGRVDDNAVIDSLPIGSTISPKRICCSQIERYVRAMENQVGAAITVHLFADGNAEAMEFRVDESTKYCDIPLKKLKLKKHILLASISKSGQIIIPNGDSFFSAGDTIVIVSDGDVAVNKLNDIFDE